MPVAGESPRISVDWPMRPHRRWSAGMPQAILPCPASAIGSRAIASLAPLPFPPRAALPARPTTANQNR